MKLFGEYLKEHARLIAASVLAAAIFLASFALYGLPLLAVAYPALLCLVLAAVFVIRDFAQAKRRHAEFMALTEITAAEEKMLPPARSIDDADYRRIIALLAESREKISRSAHRRWCEYLVSKFGNSEKVGKNLIIQDGQVHMANLCLAACYKINGVSGLHGEILKKDLFKDVCRLRPERFTYVTNGIDHRRWLAQINPRLHGLVSELLEGDDYLTKPEKLIGLLDYAENVDVQRRVNEIKRLNKYDFAKFLAKNDGFALDPDAILDVQVKRLHEYKRQLLCAMLITRLQMKIHDDPNADFMPVTFVFGAKAAAGYYTAKRIIELICSLADDISRDPLCKGKLQVCFMENYRVSAAEALMPAAQVSEQISTAGKEASGTGNMKLMLNGAVTIGTLDGANVEMYERLGDKNMFLFGLKTDEVGALKASGYDPQRYAREDAELGAVLDRISRGFADGKSYSDLVSNLLYNGDPYMLCADFRDYVNTHDRMYSVISDPAERARLSITNTAEAGIFAADRAIKEYAEDIWGIKL